VPKEFFESEKVLDLMEKAATGSSEAVALLGIEAAKASVEALKFNKTFFDSVIAADGAEAWNNLLNDPTKSFITNKEIVMNGFNEMFTAIENGSLKAGDAATMLNDDWIASMNDMAVKTGMSVTDMQNMLSSMGVSAKVEVKDVP
jgi:hypothetical protein